MSVCFPLLFGLESGLILRNAPYIIIRLYYDLPFRSTSSTLWESKMECIVGEPLSTGSTTVLVLTTFAESASNDSSSQIVSHLTRDPAWLPLFSLERSPPYVKEWKQYTGLLAGGMMFDGLFTWNVVVVIKPEGVSNSTANNRKREHQWSEF